ncbi:MAG TPA: tripartite tricarboxylate transporter substrate binding protein [Burkholderiales bacterium]|nr:tripartite tricarboxylate transporter substrate binding protein [Burkholderiales bacterium]
MTLLKTLLPVLCAAGIAAAPALAQESWKPNRALTLIAPNAPGGTSDRTARDIQRLFQKYKLVEVPVNVVNRPGGNGTIALNQLHSLPGDPHVLLLSTSAAISNHLTGLTAYNYTDFTPLAMLLADNYGVNVPAGSAIQSARDMLDRLVKSPDAVSFGVSGVGGSNYTSLIAALKRGGVDFKRVKIASFAGGGQTSMALLGGHVGAINTGLSNMVDHLRQGKMRTLVITGPRRMGAPFAEVPTWKEVGVDVTVVGWRGIMAAKGITPAQVAYWDGVFRKLAQTEDWKADLQENFWENIYSGPADTRRKLDAEHVELKQILTELGMAK